MQKTSVQSSNIESVGHENKTLFIRFKSGVSYSYDDVPFDHYDALAKAESAGRFFHRFVKGKYRYHRLLNDPFLN